MSSLPLILALVAANPMPADEVVNRFEDRTHRFTGGEYQDEVFHYRLLKPSKVEPNKQYPVILFLHGAGERGDDNRMQLLYLPEMMSQDEYRRDFPCFLIAPQCRAEKKWVDVPWGSDKSEEVKDPSEQLLAAMEILEEVLKDPAADASRIYLTGLSMGGYGSWDAAMRYPDKFAAVVPICGGGNEKGADRIAKLPIWAFHGDEDQAVPVARSRRMIEAIRNSGGEPKYTEFKGVGHNSWTPAYTDKEGCIPWMFKQRRG